eukprot:CAMPEP_0119349566 /NCGR_PEP_ID=MMETSP1333-20130426/109616_1 /TAXON_ID=418940 /ORGANISM="Scyphosphaera apsteinii, Strain RCC1455" /LENGTH=331 /DNA_ID=CAMNT_0007362167 /DNA_START=70 /DNA_END=1062 /DNA_ORIENTATION=+
MASEHLICHFLLAFAVVVLLIWRSAWAAHSLYSADDHPPWTASTPTIHPADKTLCAIGDVHGDLPHALAALRLCGALDDNDHWVGGQMTVVQLGDVLDRGNASLPTMHKMWMLREQAAAAGGEFLMLLGNHELMNMQGRIFYVHGYSRSGWHTGELLAAGGVSVWRSLMDPNEGEIGVKLVAQEGVAIRGVGACRTLFVHAGVRLHLAQQYGSVEEFNKALKEQITSKGGDLLDSHQGPLWWRGYARPHSAQMTEAQACAEVEETLTQLGGFRMAVGHNIVPWVSTRCGGRLQMLDVGMSAAYGGRPAAWRCDATGKEARIRALYQGQPEA